MKHIKNNQLCLVGAMLMIVACNDPVVETYQRLKKNQTEAAASGRTLGKSGTLSVTEGSFFYADGNRVLDADGLKPIAEGVRRLYIKKHLLRQLAIAKGIEENIFDSPEAAAFILPQLEKIMEEYYYHHEGRFASIEDRTRKELRPDDAALEEFVKTNSTIKKAGLGRKEVEAEADRILGRVAEVRISRERQKLIEQLLKDNPPMEIFP